VFDYFHADENEQYIFLQMPWMLIKDEQFKGLSSDAKILYSLLLNRTSLSAKNGWKDENNRVYIIYTIEEIMSDINCWKEKAIKSMKELKEIGLVKSVRRGLGKPNFLYVMNFATALKYRPKDKSMPENPVNTKKFDNRTSRSSDSEIQEGLKSELQEVRKSNPSNIDLRELDPIYKDSNQIESDRSAPQESEPLSQNQTDKTERIGGEGISAQASESRIEQKKESFPNIPADQSTGYLTKPSANKYEYNTILEQVKSNIEHDSLIVENPSCEEMLEEVCHVIAATICNDYKNGWISMGSEQANAEVVRSVFLKLTKDDIEYFFECFNRQTEPIVKMNAYIRTALYRNHRTVSHHYSNRVHVDMPHLAAKRIQSKNKKK